MPVTLYKPVNLPVTDDIIKEALLIQKKALKDKQEYIDSEVSKGKISKKGIYSVANTLFNADLESIQYRLTKQPDEAIGEISDEELLTLFYTFEWVRVHLMNQESVWESCCSFISGHSKEGSLFPSNCWEVLDSLSNKDQFWLDQMNHYVPDFIEYLDENVVVTSYQDLSKFFEKGQDQYDEDPEPIKDWGKMSKQQTIPDDNMGSIAGYTKAIEINPNDASAYFYRGSAKARSGEYQSAIADYTKVIELNPNDASAYFYRGYAKHDSKDYQAAIPDYTKAIEISPKDANAYFYRGFAKSKSGDNQGAIADYNEAIALEPSCDAYFVSRGVEKGKGLGDHQGAIIDYTKALEINSQDANTYKNRGQARMILGDYIEAQNDFTSALDNALEDSEMYYCLRGRSKHALNDYTGAVSDYNKAIEIDPDYDSPYLHRAQTKIMLNDLEGAISDYSEAIEIKEDLGLDEFIHEVYQQRGSLKSKVGEFSGGIEDYDNAIEIAPDYALAYTSRGSTKKELGDLKGACEDWKKAAELGDEEAAKLLEEHCQ